jgi:predicted dehydrogenase
MSATRRQFIKNSAASLAAGVFFPALAPASALGRGGTTAPSNRVAIGLAGAGLGLNTLAKFFPFSDVEIRAVCDVDAHRLARAAQVVNRRRPGAQVRTFADFQAMFAGAGLDAVILAAPDHWHASMAVAAARAGLDIYAEAPLARLPDEGRAVCRAARLHGRILQSGHWRHAAPAYALALDAVLAGRLGKITHVEIGAPPTATYAARPPASGTRAPAHLDYERWVGPGAWLDYDPRFVHHYWRWVGSYGGGELADTATHYAAIALRGINMANSGPVKITGTGTFAETPPYDVERDYRCVFTFANGVQMVLSSAFPPGVKFHGGRGWLHVGDAENTAVGGGGNVGVAGVVGGAGVVGVNAVGNVNRLEPRPAFLRAAPAEILDERNTETGAPPPPDHWREFVDCVKTRRQPAASAEAAHRAATLTRLGHAAILTGRALRWDPDAEQLKNDPGAAALLLPAHRAPWGF